MIFLLLIVTKIVIATLLALLFVAAPLAIALWPLPETSWLARTVLQSLIGRAAVAGRVGAVLRAVRRDRRLGVHAAAGRSATQLVKPWVSVAALYVSFKAPQLLARQAMLAGLTPSLGGTAARGLWSTGAPRMRVGGAAGAAGGVAGRFASSAAGA